MDISALKGSDNKYVSKVFGIIGSSAQNIAGDSVTPVYRLTQSQQNDIRDLTQQQIEANYLNAGIGFESLTEARKSIALRMAGDEAFNPVTRVGTAFDPSVYTHSNIPLMMGPTEVTNLYASGGLPAEVIDKKSRAMLINGLSFRTHDDKFWTADKIEMLEEQAAATGLNDALSDTICYTFVYGGALIYPVFKDESPTSFVRPVKKLNLEKGCIDRWITIDRWNTTFVPSFLVTEQDYINPETIFIAQTAVEVHSSRCAIMRPKPMPYWAVLYNMGWSPSDFCGWMRAYYGYQIMIQSIPVMAQQMSLLLYKMPLDALNATIGPNEVEKLMAINEKKMSEWSALNPKAVNMIGEVEVVNRTFSGFEQFVGAAKSDLAAQTGIPEPSLWHTPNKGFSDNTQESLLKSSETLQMHQKYIERALTNIRDILIAHTFGMDSEEYVNAHRLFPSFNKPVISTEKDMAEVGARFAASVSSFVQSGVSPDVAISLSKPFFPSVRVTEDMVNAARESYERQLEHEEKLSESRAQQGFGPNNNKSPSKMGGQSNSGPKTQTPGVGHYSKAK